MYELYKEKNIGSKSFLPSQSCYRKIFVECFNLGSTDLTRINVEPRDFLNFKNGIRRLCNPMNNNNLTYINTSKKVKWSQIKMVRFEKSDTILKIP